MQKLKIIDKVSTLEHGNVEKLMKESERAYYQTCIYIEVQFSWGCWSNGRIFSWLSCEQITEMTSRIFIDVSVKERLWKALLLSFGNRVR